jgi:sulfate adenylyltransferase subunit 2
MHPNMNPNLKDPALIEAVTLKTGAVIGLLEQVCESRTPVTFANSLGAEDMVLTDLILKLDLPIEIFMLDTGRLPPETLDLLARVEQRYDRKLRVYTPDPAAVETYARQYGIDGFYDSLEARKTCCQVRKIEPLRRALAGKKAWVTGLRAAQSVTRNELPPRHWDADNGLEKVNPLADWSEREVWTYIRSHAVPYNALHDRSYPSIGCAPLHAGGRHRRGRARRALVVGEPGDQGVRLASQDNGRTDTKACHQRLTHRAIGHRSQEPDMNRLNTRTLTHLDWLEADAIHILREVAGQCANPALLFSGGKDSICLLRLAEKAFRPGPLPFPLLHIDTGHNYPEVIAFRDQRAAELGARLIVRSVEDSMARGSVVLKHAGESRNKHQAVTLLEAIEEFGFDACIGGARRDEEKARAKERVMSFRDAFGQWDPKNQRPELWSLYNARVHKGENIRAFPISDWTELDVWQYIQREGLELPSIYFAHRRPVVRVNGLLHPVTPLTPALPGDEVVELQVRFRTVGDITCTAPVESAADSIDKVLAETAVTTISERGATRMDDQTSESSMEERKKAGYF